MSVTFPRDVARAIREISDVIIPLVGVQAVVYRYTGSFEDKPNVDTPPEDFYERNILTDTDNIYDPPFESHVVVQRGDVNRTHSDEMDEHANQDQLQGRVKFSDYITPLSYVKVPYSMLTYENEGEAVETPDAEEDKIVRLQVLRLTTRGVDNEARLDVNWGIMRDDGNLHPDDTSLMSHVPNDFFEDGI